MPRPTPAHDRKPVVSFPTEKVADKIVVTYHDTKLAEYKALDYGTAYPDSTTFPGLKLVLQEPVDDDGFLVRRVWAGDRANQDDYNAARKWSGDANSAPILIRSYVLPESGYTPVDKGTADSEVAGAVLVSEEAAPIDKMAGYLQVTRVFETLPGPWLPFTRYDDDLGPIQGRRRAVRNTGQTPSLTATLKTSYEAREGSSVVSWEIEEVFSDGTGSSGNPAFPIQIRDIYDPDLGPVQVTTQLVAKTGSEAGSLTENAGVVTEIEYEPYNEFLLKRVTTVQTLSGPVRTGNRWDEELNIDVGYTRQIKKFSDSATATNKTPIDAVRADFETIALSATQAQLDTLHITFPSFEKVQLPDTLLSATAIFAQSGGDGSGTSTATTSGVNFRVSRGHSASSENSVAGDLQFRIRDGYSGFVPATVHLFFLPLASATESAILTKVGAARWPAVRTETENVILYGGSRAIRTSEEESLAANPPSTSTSESASTDRSVRISVSSVTVPKTLHGPITIGTTTRGSGFGANAGTPDYGVEPASLSATTPAQFPIGKFLLNADVSLFKYGYVRVTAVVVDITSDYV